MDPVSSEDPGFVSVTPGPLINGRIVSTPGAGVPRAAAPVANGLNAGPEPMLESHCEPNLPPAAALAFAIAFVEVTEAPLGPTCR